MQDLGVAGQRARFDALGLAHHALDLLLGRRHQPRLRRGRHRTQQDEVPEPVEQVAGEPARVVPGLGEAFHRAVDGACVLRGQRVHHRVDQRHIGDPEQGHGALVGHAVRARTRDELVQHRLGVPCRPAARTDDQRIHRGLDRDLLGGHVALQQLPHRTRRDQPERVVVRPRPDRRQHLVRLGRGEDEDQVFRRLLHDLEQRVEALRGDHVGLVDDEHPVARFGRGVEGAVPQLTGVVDTVVAGRVQLGDVHAARPARREGHARAALPTRLRGRALDAVERARHDARTGRLAAAARAGEQVRVVDPAGGQRGAQRLGDVVLADDLAETGGSVLAVQR